MVVKNERGQTMVEYMLLLAVAVSLFVTFYHSQTFRRLFGSTGAIGKKIKNENEFAYRHAFTKNRPPNPYPVTRDGSKHPSYFNGETGQTRFFGPKDPYP